MCPPEIFPAVTIVSHLIHHLLALPILLLAMVVSALYGLHDFPWTFAAVPLAVLPWILATGGVVLAVSVLSVHYRDLRDLLSHLLNLLFFSSPIIYSLDGLQVPALLHRVLVLNPLASLVTLYRDIVFAGVISPPGVWVKAYLVGLIAWWLGATVFARFRETLVEAV
jgi:ABC-type polysaccharide/polyol phosphate export permease